MSLSPNDIRNYEFPSQMRGYDKEEVDSFLDTIATSLENMKQETLKLSMENDSIKSQLDSLKEFEDSIKGAAIDARKNADATMANAKDEAEQIMADATAKADNLVSSKEAMISEYKKQLNRLEETKKSYATELKDIIKIHLAMVNKISETEFSYEGEDATSDDANDTANVSTSSEPIEVTNSSEVDRNQMETVGTEATQEKVVTEDANAAEEIVVAEEAPIDPELAAALAGFEHPEPTAAEVTSDTMIGVESTPKQGEVVETTKRAEDIPEGFIVGGSDDSGDDDDTGKMGLAPEAADSSGEHNAISIDEEKLTPDNLVEELDNVVAKFEEEMDKAEAK